MMSFGEILYELRKEFGLSQEQLAQMLNVTNRTISSWEISRTEPPLKTLIEIADIFSVSLDYLLGRSADTAINDPYQKIIKKNHIRFLKALNGINLDLFSEKEINVILNTLNKLSTELLLLKESYEDK